MGYGNQHRDGRHGVQAMRLDKLLSQCGFGSRKDVKALLKQKTVTVDGEVITQPETHVNPASQIWVGGAPVVYEKYIYLMMNKPPGVVSAAHDRRDQTVIDLLEERYGNADLFPVGRLDKDTTGLVILSNDGGFAHKALSPKKHVEKVYRAEVSRPVTVQDVAAFAQGVTLGDGYVCLPAVLSAVTENTAEVVIREGKFHQVKRMFAARGIEVLALERVAFAGIALDKTLPPGEYRPLNMDEMRVIEGLLSH